MSLHSFCLQEATIDDIHFAFRSGELTCRKLIEMYLARIEAYDKKGPEINALVTLNEKALAEADELDKAYKQNGEFVGPLHGIPVLVKDQIETKEMITTFGSIAFKNYIPENDATIIKKLREAGAIILGKTNLPDFATSWYAISSVLGETKNPYALDRDPGGSSGGTAAAVAANFCAVGIGEDTGGSIRLPSSFNNLFGVRVTTGLISRNGTAPLVTCQDTTGPITRSVKDAAILLDTMIGYDPSDPYTVMALNRKTSNSYVDHLSTDGLVGARIGVLRQVFGNDGSDPDFPIVNKVVNEAIKCLNSAGAEIVDPVALPGLDEFIELTSLYISQSKYDINKFLGERPRSPVKTIDELYQTEQYHKPIDLFVQIAESSPNPEDDPMYYKRVAYREIFRRNVLNVMASHNLDCILFPTVRTLPTLKSDVYSNKWGVLNFPTNTLIAPQTGLPEVSMPAGFAEGDIPVGLDILGKPCDEATLLKIAYAYEQYAKPRKAPRTVPPLSD